MPLDQTGYVPWEPPEDPHSRFEGCYTVLPIPGPRGGVSKSSRWQVDELRRDDTGGMFWFPVLCFREYGGAREARIFGGLLLREHRGTLR